VFADNLFFNPLFSARYTYYDFAEYSGYLISKSVCDEVRDRIPAETFGHLLPPGGSLP
jgi:hypothetical protein